MLLLCCFSDGKIEQNRTAMDADNIKNAGDIRNEGKIRTRSLLLKNDKPLKTKGLTKSDNGQLVSGLFSDPDFQQVFRVFGT